MSRNTIHYEWFCEELDSDLEVVDIDYADTLKDLGYNPTDDKMYGLIRRVGSENAGEKEREFAYVVNGVLPPYFIGSKNRIPLRFFEELNNLK